MAPRKNNSDRAPLGDVTNTIDAGSQSASSVRTQTHDARERKRERERARRAAMTEEQKIEANKKKRENYHKRKAQTMLHREPKDDGSIVDLTNKTHQSCEGGSMEIVGTPNSSSDIDCVTPPYSCKPIAQRTSTNEWYKNMTPEEREARRAQQRLHYTCPGRKHAMKVSRKMLKEMRKNTLHKESIAMENPIFVPKPVWPTAEGSRANGTTLSSRDWLIPEVSATPIYIPPSSMEMDEDGCSDILPGHMTHGQRVSSGERQALLTRRNILLEGCIGGQKKETTKRSEPNAEDNMNDTQQITQSDVINNDCTGPNIQTALVMQAQAFVDHSGNLEYC